jgi:hypothetical protein
MKYLEIIFWVVVGLCVAFVIFIIVAAFIGVTQGA